jgi:nicotinamide mononucleotide adenylyltransferase
MSFGSSVESREPFDTGMRIATLENHLIESNLDQLRVIFGSLKMVFENAKFDKESEINERLSSMEKSVDGLKDSLKLIESSFSKAMQELFERIKGHVQASLMDIMRTQSTEIIQLIESKMIQVENTVTQIECYNSKKY